MTKTRLLLSSAAALVALAGAAAVYLLFIKDDAPAAVSIEGAVQSLATATPGRTSAATTSGAGAATAAASPVSGSGGGTGLTGEWTLATGTQSFLGYRVKEELAGIGANTAVGRTPAITASMTFDGSAITKLQVSADLTQLKSDSNIRDGQLRTQAIETGRFPNATFSLISPIPIGSVPPEGQTITRTIQGNLTLHGVTKAITIEVQGQIKGGQVIVVGSTPILFADYSIGQPRGAAVLSIEDRGVMELQLVFAKAGG